MGRAKQWNWAPGTQSFLLMQALGARSLGVGALTFFPVYSNLISSREFLVKYTSILSIYISFDGSPFFVFLKIFSYYCFYFDYIYLLYLLSRIEFLLKWFFDKILLRSNS